MKYRVNGFFYFPFVADCFYYPCIHFLSYTPSPLSLDNVSRAGARDVNYRRIKICIRAAAGVPLREKEGDGIRRESMGRNGNGGSTAQVYHGNLCGFRGAHFGNIWRFCCSSLIPMDVYIVKGDGDRLNEIVWSVQICYKSWQGLNTHSPAVCECVQEFWTLHV